MAGLDARYKPGVNIPCFCKTAVTGGRFVKIVDTKTADGDYQIGQAAAGDWPLGVAIQDSGPTTQSAQSVERRVNVVSGHPVVRVAVGATIDATSGAVAVKSDVNGKAIPQGGSGTIIGYALHSAATTDDFVEVALL